MNVFKINKNPQGGGGISYKTEPGLNFGQILDIGSCLYYLSLHSGVIKIN